MNELRKTITWNNIQATEEQIKGYVENYCRDYNVYYTNLTIKNDTVSFVTYSNISYESLTVKLIREKYPLSEEFALINKGIADPQHTEYVAYREYVEQCKTEAKQFITERYAVLNK